ncbi:hypothetical protein FDF29_06535 [Clostridium botulinum]|uniref:Hypothetical phage protein n=1 Tax=Clostridium botulinum (strain Hall / ATCC 3502 / NCTC 13319 / Type A) TaxID=441771 RepID=A5I4B6_CLOBH|nr:hypothetical protein [Clostridium botulinum]NFL68469.1 hypothetical protein [Clostridium botulinum]NFQ52979.1 hypothetical protein [Clostridium botulinum]NFT45907.1 hypothetical protein [Clostridium botulinum]QGT41846.1 hypothetical protein GJ703_00023 [Clostridium botulinum]CAL83888.1 hypothetical phage protein [Clostridium botulinum A str. ATCC 3502]
MDNLKLADVEIHYDIDKSISKVVIDGKDFSMVTKSAKVKIDARNIPILQLDIYTDNVKFKGKANTNTDINKIED